MIWRVHLALYSFSGRFAGGSNGKTMYEHRYLKPCGMCRNSCEFSNLYPYTHDQVLMMIPISSTFCFFLFNFLHIPYQPSPSLNSFIPTHAAASDLLKLLALLKSMAGQKQVDRRLCMGLCLQSSLFSFCLCGLLYIQPWAEGLLWPLRWQGA